MQNKNWRAIVLLFDSAGDCVGDIRGVVSCGDACSATECARSTMLKNYSMDIEYDNVSILVEEEDVKIHRIAERIRIGMLKQLDKMRDEQVSNVVKQQIYEVENETGECQDIKLLEFYTKCLICGADILPIDDVLNSIDIDELEGLSDESIDNHLPGCSGA